MEETIPEDALKAAEPVVEELARIVHQFGSLPSNADVLIARAILGERDRCANIADAIVSNRMVAKNEAYISGMNAAAVDIATSIRSGV